MGFAVIVFIALYCVLIVGCVNHKLDSIREKDRKELEEDV